MTLPQTQGWRALEAHAKDSGALNIVTLNKEEKDRAARLVHTLDGVTFDFSKNLVSLKTIDLLLDFARQQDVSGNFARMAAGEKINTTEDRAVWHTALRKSDPTPEVKAALAQIKKISDAVRADKSITDVIHIGIGGSDLGPRLVCAALAGTADGPQVHFVANIDPDDLDSVLAKCDPKSTAVTAVSKTFTTLETLTNLRVARTWLKNDARIFAITTNVDAARKEGIAESNILPFWDWVGGRFSVWSAVGLPIAIANGFEAFSKFLGGAHAMDAHTASAPLEKNIPTLMALLVLWNRNFLNCPSYAVLPYSERLALLPSFLQQLEMESNGKRVDRNGEICTYATSPVVFGAAGTNSQHAFMQMIHQGPQIIPCDFIGVAPSVESSGPSERSRMLMANMHAQIRALVEGGGADPHRITPGNRPSTAITLPRLDAYSLGLLLAAQEHKTAVLGFLWNINSFDQFGVELGKILAKELLAR